MDEYTLGQWVRGIRTLHVSHARAASRFARRGRWLGIPVIVLTTVLGTGIFAALPEENIPDAVKIVGGMLAALATVLSALQTFLGYPALAERHDRVSVGFGELRRDLERSIQSTVSDAAARSSLLEDVAARWSALEREAPIVPNALYRQASEQVSASEQRRRERTAKATTRLAAKDPA